MLKLELAGAIRAAGWYAELEVPAKDGSWRADVMASSPDGTRSVTVHANTQLDWNPQLGNQVGSHAAFRALRRAFGLGVCAALA